MFAQVLSLLFTNDPSHEAAPVQWDRDANRHLIQADVSLQQRKQMSCSSCFAVCRLPSTPGRLRSASEQRAASHIFGQSRTT